MTTIYLSMIVPENDDDLETVIIEKLQALFGAPNVHLTASPSHRQTVIVGRIEVQTNEAQTENATDEPQGPDGGEIQ